MNKRAFLKTTGLLGIASLTPFGKIFAKNSPLGIGDCTLIPSETAGPFPLDLTANSAFFRKDVRESKTGVQLNLKMKIIGVENCEPMQNVRVNIWHCDKDGNYSGYDSQAGQAYLRGFQMTDANGEVEFITIFPGWYPGRTCHIHFQVYVSSAYAAISQLTFDHETKNALYAANASIYTKGADPVTPLNDGVFSDGYAYQLATLTPNTGTGGYDSFLEVAVQGSGTLGVGYTEMQNAKQFALGQNFPNPYFEATTIPFTLYQRSDVTIELWDMMGRKIATIARPGLDDGAHSINIDLKALGGIPTGSYVYQFEVGNADGVFRDCKLMTSI